MPEMSDILRQRAAERLEKVADLDQSFEAKHARAMEGLNRQLKPRIDAVRLIGPAKPQMAEKHRNLLKGKGGQELGLSRCRFCDPPPQVYKCPKCDWETLDRWRMKLHNGTAPKWCQDRADKKARAWSRQA